MTESTRSYYCPDRPPTPCTCKDVDHDSGGRPRALPLSGPGERFEGANVAGTIGLVIFAIIMLGSAYFAGTLR